MKSKVLLLALLALGMCFAGLSVSSFTLNQESYKPGSDGILTIQLSNPLVAGTDVRAVNAINAEFTTPPQLLMKGEQFVGDIEPGGVTQIALPFKVTKNATSAIYSVEVEISGFSDRPGTQGGTDTFSRRVTIPVIVVNSPILTLSTDNQVIGGIDSVGLAVMNNGGQANNLRITVADGSNVGLYGVNELYLPSTSGNDRINVTFDSRSAANGPTDIPLVLTYEDELGIKKTETSTLRMTVRNEKLNINFNQKTDILTRKDSTLTLELVNNGDTNLRDVRLSFQNSSIRLKNEEELKFGDIPAGGTAAVTVVLFTDAPPGVNSIDSVLTYIEKDVQKEETRKVPLTVTSDADVAVYLEAKPLPLTLGSDHTISVLVSNLGSYRIENVDVSIESPALRSVDISDRQYIGGLSNDDFSTVQFQMQVNASGEGTYPALVTVNYRDQSGEWKQKVISQEISVYSPPAQEGSAVPLIAGLVILAAGIWWFKFRKK